MEKSIKHYFQPRGLEKSTSQTSNHNAVQNTSNSSEPDPFDSNTENLSTMVYPKNKDGRSFRPIWLKQFSWLQYCPEKDCVFCSICSEQKIEEKATVFTKTGFSNWKKALDKEKGFPNHENLVSHITAKRNQIECLNRKNESKEVSTLVNSSVLEERQYYITTVVEIIQLLATHQLPFRGSYNDEKLEEEGIFMALYNFTLLKDAKFADIAKRIPKNATYTSGKIQNELIKMLAETVRNNIVEQIRGADIPQYTLFMDGTRNKSGEECISFGIRYIKEANAFERILWFQKAEKCDAKSLSTLTLQLLRDCNLNTDYLLSQCYDGANVMSGKNGGIQAILQKTLCRKIPYVHCYNHRLHLVVREVVSSIKEVDQFFDYCRELYKFFRHANVRDIYKGKKLVRLLEQRWSGHCDVVVIIFEEFQEILNTLIAVKTSSQKFDATVVAKCIGLYFEMSSLIFRFTLCLMKKILCIIQPADTILQKREISLLDCNEVVNSVIETLQELRDTKSDETFELLVDQSKELDGPGDANQRSHRKKRRLSSLLSDYYVYEFVNEPDPDQNEMPRDGEKEQNHSLAVLKRIYNDTLDNILSEFHCRFSENVELLSALKAVKNLSTDMVEYDFFRTINITIPSQEEITVARKYIEEKYAEKSKSDSHKMAVAPIKLLYQMKEAFPHTYALLAVADTFGCSTAICESSFSTLTHVDKPQRRSMLTERLLHLTYLAFEKKTTDLIDKKQFLRYFNESKNRRLQLF